MKKNSDGLIPGQQVDFPTLQRVLRDQREAQKNAANKPAGATKRRGKRAEDVRKPDEPKVSDVVPSEATQEPGSIE